MFCLERLIEPHKGELPLFNTSGRGRAKIAFTMPAQYEAFPISAPGKHGKIRTQKFPYQDGQAVHITVAGGGVNRNHRQVTGVATAKTFVELPPT